jgi:hypothetical protein
MLSDLNRVLLSDKKLQFVWFVRGHGKNIRQSGSDTLHVTRIAIGGVVTLRGVVGVADAIDLRVKNLVNTARLGVVVESKFAVFEKVVYHGSLSTTRMRNASAEEISFVNEPAYGSAGLALVIRNSVSGRFDIPTIGSTLCSTLRHRHVLQPGTHTIV